MNFKSFFRLVEIQTKAASMIPLLLGTMYALYRYNSFKSINFLYMLISLLCFDMATTAINNYIDYRKAQRTHGYGYETHNAIVKYGLKEPVVLTVIIALIILASAFGIMLFLNTGVIVLLLGLLSFAVGILYSFGPVPISRMPLGEVFSGFFMGFIIIFISVYIHIYNNGMFQVVYKNGMLNVNVNIVELLYIFLISIPSISCIANIMLANNICDIEEDLENKRYTLPIYVGRERALKIFTGLYIAAFFSVITAVIVGAEPISCLLAIFSFTPVSKNIKAFYKLQTKKNTFGLSVKNFLFINGAVTLTIAIVLVL